MAGKSSKVAAAKPIKASNSTPTAKKAEKSVEVLPDSDDSDDIDLVDTTRRPAEPASDDDSDDDDSGSDDDSGEDVVGQLKKPQQKAGTYAPYAPPQGMSQFDMSTVKTTVASSAFEWNALAAKPGVELWAIRVPRNFKPAKLADLQPTTDAESSSSGVLGTVQTSKLTYQLRVASTETSMPSDASSIPNTEQDPAARPSLADSMLLPDSTASGMDIDGIGKGPREQGDTNTSKEDIVKVELGVGKVKAVGGEEMEGLRLVVPDVRRNALYMAPKKITRHLILAPLAPQVHSTDETELNDPNLPSFVSTSRKETTEKPAPTKRPQPLEKLKFRNVPFGSTNTETKTIVDRVDPQRDYSVSQLKRKADLMDIDEPATSAPEVSSQLKEKKEKKKSRKSEVAGEAKEKKSERKEKKSSRKSVA